MNASIKKPLIKPRLTLFWRLFLSLLLTILFTVIASVVVERWLNERALSARMDAQIEQLLIKREALTTALEAGDFATVRQLYQQDRRFMNQIRIYDEQGAIIFPRYGRMQQRHRRMHQTMPPSQDSIAPPAPGMPRHLTNPSSEIEETVINMDNHPEMEDSVVTLPEGQSVILQIRPHLDFADVVALQRSNFIVRLILIVLFSVLVCLWLSRTMIRRIRHVQSTVRQMIAGNYQANPAINKLGVDELGLLAKDVAQLSTRLVDSELARKQMLSDISHELRSPLARLEVATELTRDFAPNAERYLDRIDKESARMNELIEQIIHIQSLQMQQYTLDDTEKEQVNIAQIISEIGQDVCFEFQHKNVSWEWQSPIDQSAWSVFGSQEQLHSAFENIIRNAFMHTLPDSVVSAKIAKVQMDNARPAIKISIADEGEGVAEQDLERIFQPFVRLDSARHRQTGGYGLGLAIVHAVVMAHKGQITAKNREDDTQGLIVEIILPKS
ncbi:sensor histidine kinase [Psychrobacter jeotgali]|uniref:sensor histidine kinase n=1 Tax=Psychrobacter jeotgali TaxID=179010 RepID=UPI001917B4AD|nr:ATP-binding protein [Psychrobacter jeotgali]